MHTSGKHFLRVSALNEEKVDENNSNPIKNIIGKKAEHGFA